MNITVNDITEKHIASLFDGKDTLTATEISKLDIFADDRVWCLGRLVDKADPTRSVARRIALDVADKWDMPDVVKEYLVTGKEELRSASRDAAWAAARATVFVADSSNFASLAAWGASSDEPWEVSCNAAWDASAAALAASRAAALEKYITWMAEYLDKNNAEEEN
jgi:MoxR-like ATPase